MHSKIFSTNIDVNLFYTNVNYYNFLKITYIAIYLLFTNYNRHTTSCIGIIEKIFYKLNLSQRFLISTLVRHLKVHVNIFYTMKTIYLIITIFLVLTIKPGYTQTRVTGHVFAEVVESVSASSQSQSNFIIQRNETGSINYGNIAINSASSASCSLLLSDANLTGNNQKHITMETYAFGGQGLQANAINGNQSINIQCQPCENMLDQDVTSYTGNVNIVLAYN